MSNHSTLGRLLASTIGDKAADSLFQKIEICDTVLAHDNARVPRAVLAQALNMILFGSLIERVDAGRAYVADCLAQGRKVRFDHGALRTVLIDACGALPPGEAAFTRILLPLGYRANGLYPLPALGMTGRAYAHDDFPEDLAQFFVSELHPERFSDAFYAAVSRVLSTSRDPLSPRDIHDLEELRREQALPFEKAARLLPALVAAFDRHHAIPSLSDYELLLAESPEMAWISTEGNVFNHATDRVDDVFAVAEQQKALGRPIKERVEVSGSGRVKQTAFRAATVVRRFTTPSGVVERSVPGSFYEFITREPDESGKLDLRFDSGNATGIFKMTAAKTA